MNRPLFRLCRLFRMRCSASNLVKMGVVLHGTHPALHGRAGARSENAGAPPHARAPRAHVGGCVTCVTASHIGHNQRLAAVTHPVTHPRRAIHASQVFFFARAQPLPLPSPEKMEVVG